KKLINYIKFIFNLASGFLSSIKLIKTFDPGIILGMGGYVCAPVLLSAVFLRKRFVLHEQNFIPGRLNKFFSKFCYRIFISFEDTRQFLNINTGKIVFSGNPVRKIIREASNKKPDYAKFGLVGGKFTITAFGGSLGADKINNSFIKLYEKLKDREDVQFLLISGSRFYEDFKMKNINTLKNSYSLKVFPYVDEMDEIYNLTDLLISRSGANTIAEIAFCNIPAILIPYPWAIDNHQYYNAFFLEKNGKAIILNDKNLNDEGLYNIFVDLEKENKKLYNDLKYKKTDFNFMNGHKTLTKFLVGEKN
ncbi:MAG: UDP-N-acetylglucosamine--N-acetylmuramyl-(pentapeptide) pyrophosphoryl-undecaprenol N-acetylglucosamine transferase, partial [Actinobacteria bacterium]|nr:UDP-N-acetylglucosamine--N-acetylmuramyl-(pentapeptide) pyrophosphoryl-undecaprenol N-acetylglucosamine transferase [Actinomycetota bacterium]